MRFFFKLFLVRCLIVVMLLPGLVQAQALPVSSMQRAMSALIGSNLAKRGVTAANDARYAATFQGVGVGIGSAAAAGALITAAGVTAPAWVTAAATAALGALLAYGANIAIDGLKMIFNADGTVSVPSAPSASGAPAQGTSVWCVYNTTGRCGSDSWATGTDSSATAAGYVQYWLAANFPGRSDLSASAWGCEQSGNVMNCQISLTTSSTTYPNYGNFGLLFAPLNWSGYSCVGVMLGNGTCLAPTPHTVTSTPSDAVAALSDADKAKAASPDLLAQIADKAYQYAASQPGYAGVPYDASNPITAADAQAVMQANPALWPTVGDMVSPQPAPSGQPIGQPFTVPVPSSVSNPDGGTDPSPGASNKVEVTNFGDFAAPILESTPTVQSIVDPLLNLWPSWSNFAFPQHESSCPRPSFTLPGGVMNGATVNFTQMCDFIDQNNVRQAMQAAFAVAWAIVIVFIVMSA